MESIHLAAGMFIHEASVLIVILNAMRLIRFNHKEAAVEAAPDPSFEQPSSEFTWRS